ncbi:MAG: DedA family protein [Deltaproteobacteria bacterium]|nr:DedA family protein [Deltaproteobacteria bacterium]
MNSLKKLYFWTLSWSESKYSAYGLFLIAFIESSFFPIPPDILLIPLVLGSAQKWFYFATICTIGSVLGGIFGYFIGNLAMETLGQLIISHLGLESKINDYYSAYAAFGPWLVLIGAFTPVPYKVITILSGAMNMNLFVFAILSILGRGARFYAISILLWLFGERIRVFIDKYFNILSVLFVLLLLGGFLALKFLK